MSKRLGGPELYGYLADLEKWLRDYECLDAAERVHLAGRFASGSMTEFFGEARIALVFVQQNCENCLSNKILETVGDYLARISNEFDLIGGA